MEIKLTLSVDEDEMVDEADSTGLTNAAFDELTGALMDLGYSFVDGPTAVSK